MQIGLYQARVGLWDLRGQCEQPKAVRILWGVCVCERERERERKGERREERESVRERERKRCQPSLLVMVHDERQGSESKTGTQKFESQFSCCFLCGLGQGVCLFCASVSLALKLETALTSQGAVGFQ